MASYGRCMADEGVYARCESRNQTDHEDDNVLRAKRYASRSDYVEAMVYVRSAICMCMFEASRAVRPGKLVFLRRDARDEPMATVRCDPCM